MSDVYVYYSTKMEENHPKGFLFQPVSTKVVRHVYDRVLKRGTADRDHGEVAQGVVGK